MTFCAVQIRLHRFFMWKFGEMCGRIQLIIDNCGIRVADGWKRLPCVRGKRSAVAVVNVSPVDWQSRDRARRSELSEILDF